MVWGYVMSQTSEGALKVRAARVGISVNEYLSRVASGLQWCTGHKVFHDSTAFNSDRSRHDGRGATCREYANARTRSKYILIPVENRRHGPACDPPRNGDRFQARRRINVEVRTGKRAHPNTLPCSDCDHVFDGDTRRRHEYDHFLGYNSDHHYDVQVVCKQCHAKRAVVRGETSKGKSRKRRCE